LELQYKPFVILLQQTIIVGNMPNRVIHSYVTEEQIGNGKVEYKFNEDAGWYDDIYIYDWIAEGNPRSIVKPFLNYGQPTEIKYYDKSGSLRKLIKNRYKTYYRKIIAENSFEAVSKISGNCY